MSRIAKLLVLSLLPMLFMGCEREMDPFTGGLGIRMNVNGKRCVSFDSDANGYAEFSTTTAEGEAGTYSFSKTMSMQMTGAGPYEFFISASSTSPMTVGKAYACEARLEIDMKHVPLNGNLTFVSLADDGQYVEAEFELSGNSEGKEYVVKHGFLRLKRR